MAEPSARSPAPRWLKSAIAGAFLLVWVAVIVISFYRPEGGEVPLWWIGTGLVVLGYLLGINIEDMRAGGSR
jgi:fatty acid desaturase